MHPEHPRCGDIPGLRSLWRRAFGDPEEFLDGYFSTAWAPERCLCIRQADGIAAALHWLDFFCRGRKIAYVYAVATRPECRGRGLCRSLMAEAHRVLKQAGYAGAILVPENPALAAMYEKMGYAPCCGLETREFAAGGEPQSLRRLGPGEYQRLRNARLPPDGLTLGEQTLAFLALQGEFFAGEGWVLAAVENHGCLRGLEYLGPLEKAPGIALALGCDRGSFRIPAAAHFAWYHPLTADAPIPGHLGFAFD